MKSACVAIVGRPSSGKSTLINSICGTKISIATPLPQTTRNAIRGILNSHEGQLVFIDTPGFHISGEYFNRQLLRVIEHSLEGVDAILYLVDTTRMPGQEEEGVAELISGCRVPVVVGLNKKDLAGIGGESVRTWVVSRFPEATVHAISALHNDGVQQLVESIYQIAPEGIPLYPEDHYTDRDIRFRIGEVIRERVLAVAKEELPYSIYVDVADLELSDKGDKLWARAFILVERSSQTGILVGKGGRTIAEIRRSAEGELNSTLSQRLSLDLVVKVRKGWKKNRAIVRGVVG